MRSFQDFLEARLDQGGFSTEDALASFLPLVRQVIKTHADGQVAPLEGINELRVEGVQIWFPESATLAPRDSSGRIRRMQERRRSAVDVVGSHRRTTDVDEGVEQARNLVLGSHDQEIDHPVYLPGYVSWEHLIEHHDPVTDVFSLGFILASLACGMNFADPANLEAFVGHRRNLFSLTANLHPVVARLIVRMTELNRQLRPPDLPSLLLTLENYRDQAVVFDDELAQIPGFREQDRHSKQFVVCSKLRDRLFDLTRRNRLLHFRTTSSSINLTHASVPLSFDIENIRPDQILTWNAGFREQVLKGERISLNRYLNFSEALYLPAYLDRLLAEARRDEAEYGFAQLRLAICFLNWANLKEKPIEHYDSPLVLLPVKLRKKKGIRDVYELTPLTTEAEVNPVVRHLFKQLYDILLPEIIDLKDTTLEAFHEYLVGKISSSDVSVNLDRIDRPRIELVYERARRKLDQYRRRARLAGRGIRQFLDMDYSYDPANYHPLGLTLFTARVRHPESRLRRLVEENPRPRSYAVSEESEGDSEVPVVQKERAFYHLQDGQSDNPYNWTFDLCRVTLANLRYRKMSLVRDYEALLEQAPENPAFEATFSLSPRPTADSKADPLDLPERHDVVPCDPTQAESIREAREGGSYIIQGPPGTGKSQTITNLIADYSALGKRVLFVCEKRAAIDVVYARLRQCKLGELCCLIHDSQADKKAFVADLKRTYEGFLAEEPGDEVSRDSLLSDLAQQVSPLKEFQDAMLQTLPGCSLTVRELIGKCVALGDSPQLSDLEHERLPDLADWETYRTDLERFDELLRVIQSDGIVGHHPLALISHRLCDEERPLGLLTEVLYEVEASLTSVVARFSQSRVPTATWESLRQTLELIHYAQEVEAFTETGQLPLLERSSPASEQLTADLKQLSRLEEETQEAMQVAQGWQQLLSEAEARIAAEQARKFEQDPLRWLKPSWWRLRGVLRNSYDFAAHTIRPSWVNALDFLLERYAAENRFEAESRKLAESYGLGDNHRQMRELVDQGRENVGQLSRPLRTWHEQLLHDKSPHEPVSCVVAAASEVERLAELLEQVADGYADDSLVGLQERVRTVLETSDRLPDYLRCLRELQEAPPAIYDAVKTFRLCVTDLEAAIAERSLQQVFDADLTLKNFDGASRLQAIERLDGLYRGFHRANAGHIIDTVRQRFREHVRVSGLPAARLTSEQKEFKKVYNRGRRELEHEFGKSMRYKPIRDLVSGDSGCVVRDLKPVWLMSPLSVSDTLPLATQQFDVVIFDEASQITLEEAVPSLFRAPQTIVVGDEMQLPPTDFFSSRRDLEDEELTIEEDGELVEFDLESSSFLNHSARNLPSSMLGWHYRSRSESLISFSNWAFYGGRLLTVPEERLPEASSSPILAPDVTAGSQNAKLLLDRPISFHLLDSGVYEKRRNRPEAEYVANLVRALLTQQSGYTIGVVAFSEAQQDEIENALNRAAQDDKEFASLYEAELEREEDGQFVGLLVKNLENIQGDERDIIILSVCYGHDRAGKMRMNFGPINKSGGEKRLNVAFSRAKQFMAVVSSITYGEITNDYNEGANCLKQYLRYAQAVSDGEAADANAVLRAMGRELREDEAGEVAADSVARQVAEELERLGYAVDFGIGQSHFQCDLAVRREGDTAYRLGILVDRLADYRGVDLVERELLRPNLLRAFGWKICHVLAKDWHHSREACLAQIEKEL